MNIVRDRFGNILRKDSYVAYIQNGLIERGRVVKAFCVGTVVESVEIEQLNGLQKLVVRPANAVMSVMLPAT